MCEVDLRKICCHQAIKLRGSVSNNGLDMYVNFVEFSFHGFYIMCSKTYVIYQFHTFCGLDGNCKNHVTQENSLPYNITLCVCF